jgi:hypothetical protein
MRRKISGADVRKAEMARIITQVNNLDQGIVESSDLCIFGDMYIQAHEKCPIPT